VYYSITDTVFTAGAHGPCNSVFGSVEPYRSIGFGISWTSTYSFALVTALWLSRDGDPSVDYFGWVAQARGHQSLEITRGSVTETTKLKVARIGRPNNSGSLQTAHQSIPSIDRSYSTITQPHFSPPTPEPLLARVPPPPPPPPPITSLDSDPPLRRTPFEQQSFFPRRLRKCVRLPLSAFAIATDLSISHHVRRSGPISKLPGRGSAWQLVGLNCARADGFNF
jgi:hypothetical protein